MLGTVAGDIHDIGKNIVKTLLEAAGFVDITIQEEVQEAEMLVSPVTLDHWFAVDARRADRDRPSYAQYLLRWLAADELAEVKILFQRQLAGQTVPWQTRIAFVVGQIAPAR